MPREVEWERPLLVWQRKLCQGGAILASCLLTFGIGGIIVLTDKRKTGWLTNSEFGRLWERIVALNYVFVPLCVVGGMLGVMLCLHNLQQDSLALSKAGLTQSTARMVAAKKRPQRAKKVD